MIRRFRSLVYVLAALQALLTAPVVNAVAGAMPGSDMACADMMPADDSGSCPCCPDGDNLAACLSNCLAAAASTASYSAHRAHSVPGALPAQPVVHLADRADPPLKPPPIR